MAQDLFKYISYPIYYRPLTWIENIVLHSRIIIKCPVCGHFSIIKNIKTDLLIREYCNCIFCNSQNRQRQIAYILTRRLRVQSLKAMTKRSEVCIFNTETSGALHKTLAKTMNYVSSEYLGSKYKSGQIINGIRHEDLQNLSFNDSSFDFLISADVFEHVPDPYKAHKEVFRVLKPGGRHIFTVPFYQEQILDEKRAILNETNDTIFFKEPLYHNDPLNEKGVLVYNIFSLEMLVKLAEIGFTTNLYRLHIPSAGIWGRNAVVFEAIKSQAT
jgi:SAM-dependent methyltransferase